MLSMLLCACLDDIDSSVEPLPPLEPEPSAEGTTFTPPARSESSNSGYGYGSGSGSGSGAANQPQGSGSQKKIEVNDDPCNPSYDQESEQGGVESCEDEHE